MTESSSQFFKNANWKAGKKRTNVDLKNVLSENFEKIEIEEPVSKTKVIHFENGRSIVEKIAISTKKEVVIPKVVEEDWRVKRLRQKEAEGTLSDEDRARLALMLEANGETTSSKTEKVDVDRRNEDPDDPDYNAIDISEFGMAILRGYGFKEDEGIGRTNKKTVKLATPVRRKNVGIGAAPIEATSDLSADGGEDLKVLKPGKYIHIERGKMEGKYGIVVSIDPDNSVCYVKLAIPGKNKEHVKVSEFNLRIVSEKEYDVKSKVINSKEYDQFKTEDVSVSSSTQNGNSKKKQKESVSSESDSTDSLWAVEDLRVRIISKKYKNGKYYKEKMVVVDASSRNYVRLADQYKRHHEVKRNHIETVIPRGTGGTVMLLTGKYKGQIGKIVERDEKSEFLRILVQNMDFVTDVNSFDDVCEYVGYDYES